MAEHDFSRVDVFSTFLDDYDNRRPGDRALLRLPEPFFSSFFPSGLYSLCCLLFTAAASVKPARISYLPICFLATEHFKRSPDFMCMIMNGSSYPKWQRERPAASGLGRGARVGCMSCHDLYDRLMCTKTMVLCLQGAMMNGRDDNCNLYWQRRGVFSGCVNCVVV